MQPVVRPHDALNLFGLGLVSIALPLLGLPLGLYVWSSAGSYLHGMDAGHVDSDGRVLTRVARTLAIIGVLLSCVFLLLLLAGVRDKSSYYE